MEAVVAEVMQEAVVEQGVKRRCGLCRAYRAATGECRRNAPQFVNDFVDRLGHGATWEFVTRWPQPPLGPSDECDAFVAREELR